MSLAMLLNVIFRARNLLLTQRLILQTRIETNAAIQRVEEFTTGSGLNNL